MAELKTNFDAFALELAKHYISAHKRILNLDNLRDVDMKKVLETADLEYWSHRERIVLNLQLLKYTLLIDRTSTITTCFKATYDDSSCIYGYLYSTADNKPEHKFVCCSPTYRSQDGEYRHRLIPWKQFLAAWSKYNTIFEQIEAIIVGKMNTGILEFQVDFYYPSEYTVNEKQFEDSIDEGRLTIKLFIFCWFYLHYQIHYRNVENHINPAYQYVVYQPEDDKLFESLVEKLGRLGIANIASRISHRYGNVNDTDHAVIEPEWGQKIFPITVFEAIRLDDINFNVWREIYFANLCSNLVLNFISPSFPFINNWFYIQNAHAGLFDNHAMHEKYQHSEVATDISAQLRNIDKFNYVSKSISKGPINNKFMRLSKHIRKSAVYADSAIKLTDMAVCVTSEYVGRTLRDIPSIISDVTPAFTPVKWVFTRYDMFVKHIFEFIYGFYCMNTKIGLLHGDLHMNNATIFRMVAMFDSTGKQLVDNPHILYIIGGEYYLFSHYGVYSMIIDFSRAIMGNFDRLEHEFGHAFAQQYMYDQRSRIMQLINHYFPKLMAKYKDQIEILLASNFPLVFKIITAIDTFSICNNIAAMLTVDEMFVKGHIQLAPGAAKFLVKAINLAEASIVKNITAAADGKLRNAADIEWPNLVILRELFADNRITGQSIPKDVNIVDVFNYNNDLKYDIEDYDSWGPLMDIDIQVKLLKKHNLPPDPEIIAWDKYRKVDESAAVDDIISRYEKEEKDIIQADDWMFI